MVDEPNCESPEERLLKSGVAAPGNRQAEAEIDQSAEWMALLLKTNASLSKSLDLKEILQTLTDSAAKMMHNGSAAVYLLEEDELYLGATTPSLPLNFPDKLRRAPLSDHPHIHKVVTGASPLILPDAKKAPVSQAERDVIAIRDLRTTAYYPLIGSKGPLGVYIAASTGVPQNISAFQRTFFHTLGTQASIAVENARLYQSARNELKEREKLQVQLIQAQKMEAIGTLAGGVAHDFNNMLGVILGHVELALEALSTDSSLRVHLEEIEKSATRSANLTRQLLAFARKQTITPKTLDLNETVASMLNMIGRLIGEDIDISWKPREGIKPIRVDPGQIDQILANLAVNARDAIDRSGGKVTIETSSVSFDNNYCATHAGFVAGDYVMLAVSDDGCGMEKETLPNIFEPFFTTKDVGKGTGLGLSTVYGIVKQNNGLINVYSEPNAGTTIRIYFPVYEAALNHVNQSQETMAPIAKGHEVVLVVEDERAILQLTQTMLEKLGYTVLTAATPGEAIREAAAYDGRIDLLISDVVMPEMNGRELIKRLNAIYPHLPHLFMSGYTANVIAHQGVLEKGVNFIQKPFLMQELAKMIRRVLSRSAGRFDA